MAWRICTRCKNKRQDFTGEFKSCDRCRLDKQRYAKTPKGKEVDLIGHIKYRKTDKGKIHTSKKNRKQWLVRNKYRNSAYKAVQYAVKLGKLEKLPCEQCGKVKSQFHHTNGYDALNKFVGKWLCTHHHREAHYG